MPRHAALPVLALALRYWAVIFALGFALGALRTLWLAPCVGPLAAVLIELPVMLAASWLTARTLLRRTPLPGRGAALAMGTLAFALLMASEAALGLWGFGQSWTQWLRQLGTGPGLAGLAGQAVFGLIPAAVWRGARARGA